MTLCRPALLLAALAVAPARARAQSAPAAPPAAWLLLTADDPCNVTVDGEAQGTLAAGEVRKLKTGPGEHLVRAKRASDGAEFRARAALAKDGDQKLVAIRFTSGAPRDEKEYPATLMLVADANCEVSVDDSPLGVVARDAVKRVPVRIEDHFVTARRPDGSLSRTIVKVDRAGQVAVAVSCGVAPAAAAAVAPAPGAGPTDAELDAWEMTGDDKYAVSVSVNPEMPVSGLPPRGIYSASTFEAMYPVIMRDVLPAALIKQGFTVADREPGDCRLTLAFTYPQSHESLLLDSELDCGGQPGERFNFSRPTENGKVMWFSPSHNKNYIEGYLNPAADELAFKLTRSHAVKRVAKKKAKPAS